MAGLEMVDYSVIGWDGGSRYLVISPTGDGALAYVYDSSSDTWAAPVSMASFTTHLNGWSEPDGIPNSLTDSVEDNLNPTEEIAKGDRDGHPFRGNQWTDGGREEREEHEEGVVESLRRVNEEQQRGNRLGVAGNKLVAAWHFLHLLDRDDSVEKGDVRGHEFHGNQWTTGASSGVSKPDRSKAARDASRGKRDSRQPVATVVKWGPGVLPDGWELQKEGANRRVYINQRTGNRAVFPATGDKNTIGVWNPGDYLTNTVMASLDKWATGRKLDFAGNRRLPSGTIAAVASGDPKVINIGNYDEIRQDCISRMERYKPGRGLEGAEKKAAEDDWESLMLNVGAGDKESIDRAEAMLVKADDFAVKKLDKVGRAFSVSDMFLSTQRQVEANICHELGHSRFYTEGSKISQIYGAINSLLDHPRDWAASQDAHQDEWVKGQLSRGFVGVDFGGRNGKVLMSAVPDYIKDMDSGAYELSTEEKRVIRSLGGVTEYGSTMLQELVAESHAAWQLPNIPDSPLTTAIAKALGWDSKGEDRVLKSARVGGVERPSNVRWDDELGGLVADAFVADTMTGPRWVVGDPDEDQEPAK